MKLYLKSLLLLVAPVALSVSLAACGTTERTVVVNPAPGSTVVVPPTNP